MTGTRRIITYSLIVAAILLIYLVLSDGNRQEVCAEQSDQAESSGNTLAAKEEATSQESKEPDHTIVYYFHGNKRCKTCLTIESYTREALKENFGEELKTGRMKWRSVDITVPENKHFVNDYQLYAQSVVLSAVRDDKQTKWKNLDKVWKLVRNKRSFFSYIQTETADFVKE